MSQRKLQQEIDRVFKKVREGLDEFDFVYQKLQDCDNHSQKEKLEVDLKKEIKKLQRSREQIKSWMSGTEVKDKKPLMDHRKLIEREMERFKEVEKMMKTKAFSNEALASTNEVVDPKKKEKLESAEFIEGNIDELQRQIEAMEAEIDQITSTLKKKKSDATKQAEIAVLQEHLGRHKWHISMLESILRHLENDNIDVEQINEIKEDIEYYVESNQDDHFVEDDTFYEALGLDDIEDSFAVIQEDENGTTSRSQSVSEDIDPVDKERRDRKEKEKLEKEREREREIEREKITPANVLLNGGLKPATPLGTPKLKYATAASAGLKKVVTLNSTPTPVSSSTPVQPSSSTPAPSLISYASLASTINSQNQLQNQTSQQVQQTQPAQPSTQQTQQTQQTKSSTTISPTSENISPNSTSVGVNNGTILTSTSNQPIPPLSPDDEKLYQDIENLASANAERILSNTESKHPQIANIQKELSFSDIGNLENIKKLPSGFDRYLKNLDIAKDRMFEFKKQEELHVPSKKSQPAPIICDLRLPSITDIAEHLESSLLNCPDSFDADKPHRYIPTNPYITHLNFPVQPLPEILGSKKLLERANLDTLFYAFYYNDLRIPSRLTPFHVLERNPDDEYLQYIAAQELNRRGWNYQSSTHTWFERDDTVPGGWRSFDYRDTWMVRRNTDFVYSVDNVELAYF